MAFDLAFVEDVDAKMKDVPKIGGMLGDDVGNSQFRYLSYVSAWVLFSSRLPNLTSNSTYSSAATASSQSCDHARQFVTDGQT